MTQKKTSDSRQVKVHQVLLVDDHPAMRTGIGVVINQEADFNVCGEAATIDEALAKVEELQPDAMVLDLTLGKESSLAHFDRLREPKSDLKILVVSMHHELIHGVRALCQRGGSADGYVQKGAATEHIVEALRTVMDGDLAASPKLSSMLAAIAGGRTAPGSRGSRALQVLTPREFEVYELIGLGQPPREIAPRLGVSSRTVEAHKENMKKKLNLPSAAALASHAAQTMQGLPPEGDTES